MSIINFNQSIDPSVTFTIKDDQTGLGALDDMRLVRGNVKLDKIPGLLKAKYLIRNLKKRLG